MKDQTKRAERRHQVARLKKKRRIHWGWWRDLSKTPSELGKAVKTPRPCSCWACGNERKYFGIETIQERRLKQPLD
jgi:hypothetical protein